MNEEKWDLVISPKRGWFDIDLAGVWRYRDLVLLLFKRDYVALYKQTILGPLWYLIQPVLMTIVFTLIFSRIAKISTDVRHQYLIGYSPGLDRWDGRFRSVQLLARNGRYVVRTRKGYYANP